MKESINIKKLESLRNKIFPNWHIPRSYKSMSIGNIYAYLLKMQLTNDIVAESIVPVPKQAT